MSFVFTLLLSPLYASIVLPLDLLLSTTDSPLTPFPLLPRNVIPSFFSSPSISFEFSSLPTLHMHPVLSPSLENAVAVFVAPPPMSNRTSSTSTFAHIRYIKHQSLSGTPFVSRNASFTALPNVTISNV